MMRQPLRSALQQPVSSGPGAEAPGLAPPGAPSPEPDTKATLPSEVLVQGQFPTPLSAQDLTILGITIVLYVSNASVITLAGAAGLSYWLLGFLTFLIPSAIITGKLARMFPEQGAFYVWTFKALGPFWGGLLGFFILWWPPVLVLIGTATFVVGFASGIGASFGQAWFVEPWQQGLVVLLALLVAWFIARLPVTISRRLIHGTLYVYLAFIALMGVSVVAWLISGHPPQTDFSASQFSLHSDSFTFYSLVILAGLGIQLPLNMAREVRPQGQDTLSRYLPRTVLIVMVSYVVVWLALAVILPQDPTNPLAAANVGNMGQVFSAAFGSFIGHPLGVLANLTFAAFYLVSGGAYSMVQSRAVVMAALDRRLPVGLAKVDPDGVPRRANSFQILIVVALTLVIFFLAPQFGAQGQNFVNIVYNLFPASASVLWALSALGLFVIGGILVVRYPRRAQEVGGGSAPLILACAVIGALATASACYLIFTGPWTTFIAPADWFFWIALLVLGSLAAGAVHAFLSAEPEDIWMLLLAARKRQAAE